MPVTGRMLIGKERVAGTAGSFQALDPTTGAAVAPLFGGATPQMLDRACALAANSFDTYRETPLAARAGFLDAIAANVLDLRDELIERGVAETGLPRARPLAAEEWPARPGLSALPPVQTR